MRLWNAKNDYLARNAREINLSLVKLKSIVCFLLQKLKHTMLKTMSSMSNLSARDFIIVSKLESHLDYLEDRFDEIGIHYASNLMHDAENEF